MWDKTIRVQLALGKKLLSSDVRATSTSLAIDILVTGEMFTVRDLIEYRILHAIHVVAISALVGHDN